MIVKSGWGILLFVFSVKSQSQNDVLFQCTFSTSNSACGFTFGNGGQSKWRKSLDGSPYCNKSGPSPGYYYRCEGLKSPSIPELADGNGPACLEVAYRNDFEALDMHVWLFNSSLFYPCAYMNIPHEYSGAVSVQFPETSYTQFSISVVGYRDKDIEIYLSTISLFRCPTTNTDDVLIHCTFNTSDSDCGFTFDKDGEMLWKKSPDGTPYCDISLDSLNGPDDWCSWLKSPSIPELADGYGPACLEVAYKNYFEATNIQVSLFNSSSIYRYAYMSIPREYSGVVSIQFPETSYTQFSIAIEGSLSFDAVVEIHLPTISLFRCPRTNTVSPATTTPETTTSISCDLKTDGTCFTYFNESMSQLKAQETCMSLQGKLAELRTESIKNLLMSEVNSKKMKMWIGAKRDKEGSFVWESDNKKLNVSNVWWKRGEPNNWRGREDCVMMKPPRGKLNDGNCDMKLTFFCQF